MSVVKINAIEVPEGAGPELEARFAARAGMVDQEPGFEEFMLLRPTAGEDRYFVVTRWESEEAFQAWHRVPYRFLRMSYRILPCCLYIGSLRLPRMEGHCRGLRWWLSKPRRRQHSVLRNNDPGVR